MPCVAEKTVVIHGSRVASGFEHKVGHLQLSKGNRNDL
jgi:hypothetical protein